MDALDDLRLAEEEHSLHLCASSESEIHLEYARMLEMDTCTVALEVCTKMTYLFDRSI